MQRTTPHTALEQQAAQAGIADSYINAHGRVQAISAQTKRRLLDAMPPRTPPMRRCLLSWWPDSGVRRSSTCVRGPLPLVPHAGKRNSACLSGPAESA